MRKQLEQRRSENRRAYEANQKSYNEYSKEERKIDRLFAKVLKTN